MQGLLSIPCVLGQLVQIFVGQPIALYLAGRVTRWHAKQEKLKEEIQGDGGDMEAAAQQLVGGDKPEGVTGSGAAATDLVVVGGMDTGADGMRARGQQVA